MAQQPKEYVCQDFPPTTVLDTVSARVELASARENHGTASITGSGTITAQHVISAAPGVLEISGREITDPKQIGALDVAMLSQPAGAGLPLVAEQVGERIWIVGWPRDMPRIASPGTVVGTDKDGDGIAVATVAEGMSGGPVLACRARAGWVVVGVVRAYLAEPLEGFARTGATTAIPVLVRGGIHSMAAFVPGSAILEALK